MTQNAASAFDVAATPSVAGPSAPGATTPAANDPAPRSKISAGGVKKTRNVGHKVVTANDLFGGHVIYFTADGTWSEDLAAAAMAEGDAAMDLLARAHADEAHAVGPYLMDVAPLSGVPLPSGRATLRETIRDEGPTIHPQFRRARREA